MYKSFRQAIPAIRPIEILNRTQFLVVTYPAFVVILRYLSESGEKLRGWGLSLIPVLDKLVERYYSAIPNPRLKSIVLHAGFWFVWLSRILYDILDAWGWKGSLIYISVVFLTQLPLVYGHLYVFVPKLLNRKKYLPYLLVTTASVFAYSFLHYTVLQALPDHWMPENMQAFISRMSPNFDLLEGVIVVILTYSLKYTLIAFITQNELLRLQKEKLQLELNALKAQVHPHFLFNTLNNLYSLTLKNSDKASEVVLKLSDIMRYVLYQANEHEVLLKKELDFIRNYMELQRIRYSDRFDISFQIEGDPDDIKIAPLLFIDFVENAFKHGLEKRFNDGYVQCSVIIQNNTIEFSVINSKSQGEENRSEIRTGIGLNNVRKRLDLIYPGHHTLTIRDMGEIFNVNLKLNIP